MLERASRGPGCGPPGLSVLAGAGASGLVGDRYGQWVVGRRRKRRRAKPSISMARAPAASDATAVPVRGSVPPARFRSVDEAAAGAATARLVSEDTTGAGAGDVMAGLWPVPD